jgi:hypothetical protein
MKSSGPYVSATQFSESAQLTARKRWRSGCHSAARAPRVLPIAMERSENALLNLGARYLYFYDVAQKNL